ncbi:MAG: NAD-dependent epimerase/dehydratase family protein [Victivallaceae bacterium]|nr:NAD-dependent epimerase/dehydratase family protein [Victivallaceae bacterium]
MNALVSGANGFIGKFLCRALSEKGYVVTGLDMADEKPAWCDRYFKADITAADDRLAAACKNMDVVFHLAAKVHALAEVKADLEQYRLINADGTANLFKAAAENAVGKFIFFSTVKVYGEKIPGLDNSRIPVDENCETVPDTPYGQSKLAAEKIVLGGNYAGNATVLRLSMVYGPGAKGNIHKMIKAMRRGIPFPLPEFHNKRSMVDVRDVVKAALAVAERDEAAGQVYIVSDGKAYSTRQIVVSVLRALGKSPWPFSIPAFCFVVLGRAGDMISRIRGRRFFFDSDALNKISGSAWFSSEKIERQLGFMPDYDLEAALPEMLKQKEDK